MIHLLKRELIKTSICLSFALGSSLTFSQGSTLTYSYVNDTSKPEFRLSKDFGGQLLARGNSRVLAEVCSSEDDCDVIVDLTKFRYTDSVFRGVVQTEQESIECRGLKRVSYLGQYPYYFSTGGQKARVSSETEQWRAEQQGLPDEGFPSDLEYQFDIEHVPETACTYQIDDFYLKAPLLSTNGTTPSSPVLLTVGTFSSAFTLVIRDFKGSELPYIVFSAGCRSQQGREACALTSAPEQNECRIELVYKRNDHVADLESRVEYQHSIAVYSNVEEEAELVGSFDLLRSPTSGREVGLVGNNVKHDDLTIVSAEYVSSNQDYVRLAMKLPNLRQGSVEVSATKARVDGVCSDISEVAREADDAACDQESIPSMFSDGVVCPTKAPVSRKSARVQADTVRVTDPTVTEDITSSAGTLGGSVLSAVMTTLFFLYELSY